MSRIRLRTRSTAMVATCLTLAAACNQDPELGADTDAVETTAATTEDPGSAPGLAAPADPEAYKSCGEQIPFDPGKFEFIPIEIIEDIFVHRLVEPNELGEDLAIHLRLPQIDPKEGDPHPEPSLIATLGVADAPVIAFRTDALVELGKLDKSPGKDFFTVFARSDDDGFKNRTELEQLILETQEISEMSFVLDGRHPIAISTAQPFESDKFFAHELVGLGRVRITPRSVQSNWLESVFITDPAVVQDPSRTYDTCTREGESCGPWTFCHLMTEMANTSKTGITPEDFTRQWLEQWKSDYPVNDDLVAARADIATRVIDPWLAASGGKQLDLSQSPFRLLAIVNRLDARRSASTPGGAYGGGGTEPIDGGELRFVFGVMEPDGNGAACTPMPFTVIFEYGVPRRGCSEVRDWAKQWVALDQMGGFGGSYNDTLADMTESIVRSGAAPGRGNDSAINQIRTNENALAPTWELREFQLADEQFDCTVIPDTETDGYLRPHSVALTPDDGLHAPTPNSLVDHFVDSRVLPGTSSSPCSANYEVPGRFDCSDDPEPFLGGNSLASLNPGGDPPGAWHANPTAGAGAQFVCGRHQFSLNTCNGCHTCDTGTTFTHVDPMSGIPATLSGFLLGTTVNDTQFSGTQWNFADLDRRYQDLYDMAGAACNPIISVPPLFLEELGLNPFDPVVDFGIFTQIFDARLQQSNLDNLINPVMEDFTRPGIPSH